MDYTDNLNLIKPAKAEQFNIDYHNTNSDIIDSAFKDEVDTRIAADRALQEQIDLNRNEERRIGIVPISKGGTGAETAQSALNALHGNVTTETDISADDEITFIERTQADVSQGIEESFDVKDIKLSDLASKVFELIRANGNSLFSATKMGLVPSSSSSSSYLKADGTWGIPAFAEDEFNLSSSQEISPVTNTIYTFTSSSAITVVLNDGKGKGKTATFFNPTAYTHTISLKLFGGVTILYIPKNTNVKLWWTGSEWFNFALSSYNVGSLYYSSQATDPANLFGGTWVQIKDRFIWAKGDSDTVNATGGSKTVQLTESNLPKHDHSCSSTNTNHTHSGTTNGMSGDNYARWQGFRRGRDGYTQGRAGYELYNAGILDGWSDRSNEYGVGLYLNLAHTHTFTTGGINEENSSITHSHDIGKTGGDVAHENMPPFIVKYCWERTA